MKRFGPIEQAALREVGVAVFADRLILERREPIDDATLAAIQARCQGPLPRQLVDLWRLSFGGALDYDLSLRFGEHVASFSLRELFYPDSPHYRDLWGWMQAQLEFEQEAAQEAGRPAPKKLGYLPIGGFEYLSRLYLDVSGGPNHGAVVAWMRGLPPAWTLRLHKDASAHAAPDLVSLFNLLDLEDDPFSPTTQYPSGEDMVAAIGAVRSASAAETLKSLVKGVVLDWRAALDSGAVCQSARLRKLAWTAVCRDDDLPTLERMLALACDPAERFARGGAPLDHALAHGAQAVTRRLLTLDVPAADAIRNGAHALTPALAQELLRRGADVDTTAVMTAARRGPAELVELLVNALLERSPQEATRLARDARDSAQRERSAAARVAAGKMGSNRTPEQYREVADRLEALARRLST